MIIAKEFGDQGGEGRAYGNLDTAYQSLGEYRKAIWYSEKVLKIAMEVGDQRLEGEAYGNLGIAFDSLGDYRKGIEYHERYLKIAKEIGDWAGELRSYHSIGTEYFSLRQFQNAVDNYVYYIDTTEIPSCRTVNERRRLLFPSSGIFTKFLVPTFTSFTQRSF